MGHRARVDRDGVTRDELDVFATGATIAHAPEAIVVRATVDGEIGTAGDRLRRSGELVRSGLEHAKDFQARPGHRPGVSRAPVGTASYRRGGDTDIVRPVLVPPAFASEFAIAGELFAEPVPNLSIHHHDDGDEERFLMWDAQLDSGGARRRVTLHLLASPSMVVTVLELVPCKRLRHGRERFVADGVAAVDVVARRLSLAFRIH